MKPPCSFAKGDEVAALALGTTRMTQVLDLAIEGLTDREMAERLGIGVETVGSYWRRIFKVGGWHARTEAVAAVVGIRCLVEWNATDDGDPTQPDPRMLSAYARTLSFHLPDYLAARKKRQREEAGRIAKRMFRVYRKAFLCQARSERAATMGEAAYVPQISIPKYLTLANLDLFVSNLIRAGWGTFDGSHGISNCDGGDGSNDEQ